MKTRIITAASFVIAFAAGFTAGWLIRKKSELQFVETTEEDLQAYASIFSQDEEKQEETEEVPKIQTEQEGTNIDPVMDTRKQDYANAWKEREEIIRRESYGEPTPGEEEDLSPTEADLDPDFAAAIEEENVPRFSPISGIDFYNRSYKGTKQEVYFWYDRDDVITEQIDDDIEQELTDGELRRLGFDIRKEFNTRKGDIEEEIAGSGLMLYLEDHQRDVVISMVRYPMSYRKRREQEEYGGAEDTIDRIHRRHGSVY